MTITTYIKKYVRYAHILKMMLLRRISATHRLAGPATAQEKWDAIEKLRKASAATTFIETGTYLGDTVERFKDSFEKIVSIEVDVRLIGAARDRFRNCPHITIMQGDSADLLPNLISSLREPALFWLDAHCSGGDTVSGKEYTPIVSELKTILSTGISHTILVDDARLFDGVNYPTLRNVRRLVRSLNPQASFTVHNDVIRILQ